MYNQKIVYKLLGDSLFINTIKGVKTVQQGDWITKDEQGEFYPYKPDIFAKMFEIIEE